MKHTLLPVFLGVLLLADAAMVHRHVLSPSAERQEQNEWPPSEAPEAGQRLVFLLQYLATDYDRAVQNGQVIDSLEYSEMERFAHDAVKIYQSTAEKQQQTLNKLRQLEGLIADRAALPQIRKLCDETIAILIKEKNLTVAPHRTPDLDYGKSLFQENCASCHGRLGAGDGPAADTLLPRPRDFTAASRMNACTPLQFYQAITFGVEGTAMPSFSEGFAPRLRWNLAFYLMTLRQDFQPIAPATPLKLTLQELATKNNIELAARLAPRTHSPHADSSLYLKPIIDYYRQNPPESTRDDYLAFTEAGLKQSLAAYQRADSVRAVQLIQEAYWDGFEFMEGELLNETYFAFERAFTEYLACIENKASPEKAQAPIEAMLKILQQIRSHQGLRSSR
jgi:high-affinity iron transporter